MLNPTRQRNIMEYIHQNWHVETISPLPAPLKSWHRASKGVTKRFKGCLTEIFPELRNLSEADMKELERKRHEL